MEEKVCTFFGHRDCPESVRQSLSAVLEDLITTQNVTMFYVGREGKFDAMVRSVLRELQKKMEIRYAVVLAYLPKANQEWEDFSDTMFPEGLENVPPRYAISRRNRWMLDRADFVVSYVVHGWGGAAKFVDAAKRQKMTVIHLP